VVAFARSAEAAVTERVQSLITQAIREGIPEVNAATRIVKDVDLVRKRTAAWSESYARMSFRTNVNTAVTAGRFRQAQDPDVKALVPCMQFDAVDDGDVRDNHHAGDGIILKVDNPAWNKVAPPLGYNCRCQVNLITVPMLRRMGRINPDGSVREDRVPSGWRPDAKFRHGGRPDLMMVQTQGAGA
jgi:SPP1 gp7 family putative phage head morphogenesis protein